jgi:hypothetical protein
MVTYLHDHRDERAHDDVAAIYRTRTLAGVKSVLGSNMRTVAAELLHDNTTVAVADDFQRRDTVPMLAVLKCLEVMGVRVVALSDYLNELREPPSPDNGLGARQPVGSGEGRRLLAEAG